MRIIMTAAMVAALLGAAPMNKPTISVAYAASLTQIMEGPVKAAFERAGYGFEGEGKGSKALAHLISAGLRNPDVFISADAGLYPGLHPFGRADLVIGYASTSAYATQFAAAAAGKASLAAILREPNLQLGRTDPALDPKGQKSLAALQALGVPPGGDDQVFPEEDLLVRAETGQVDCGFFYTTETNVPGLKTVVLPDGIGARDGIAVEYAIEALPKAPHHQGARAFVDFILAGSGHQIFERAGITYN